MTQTPSAIPGIVWPDFPAAPDAELLALLFQLEQTQWWPSERVREAQLLQIRLLARHAFSHVSLQRDRMNGCGFDPFADFGWDEFTQLPPMTRSELQRAGLSAGTPALKGHGTVSPTTGSGSTGMPVTFLTTDVAQRMWAALTLRDHLWHRRDFAEKLCVVRNRSTDSAFPDWGVPAIAMTATGTAATFPIEEATARQVQWLIEQRPGYLLTFPTNLEAMLRHCAARGIRIPSLREARTVAESLPPNLRALCREVWGVPLTDAYSAREAGYIALQCPAAAHYHVQSESVLVEVLRVDGSACMPGEQGRVVLTVLNNFATPLLRYEVGDIAVPGAPCACGRELPVLERVVGRVRNMMTLPGGERRFPTFDSKFYSDLGPVTQYQIVQKTPQRLELHVVAPRALTADEEHAITRRLLDRLRHEFEVQIVRREAIPRGPGGKYEEFMSEVPPPGATAAAA